MFVSMSQMMNGGVRGSETLSQSLDWIAWYDMTPGKDKDGRKQNTRHVQLNLWILFFCTLYFNDTHSIQHPANGGNLNMNEEDYHKASCLILKPVSS